MVTLEKEKMEIIEVEFNEVNEKKFIDKFENFLRNSRLLSALMVIQGFSGLITIILCVIVFLNKKEPDPTQLIDREWRQLVDGNNTRYIFEVDEDYYNNDTFELKVNMIDRKVYGDIKIDEETVQVGYIVYDVNYWDIDIQYNDGKSERPSTEIIVDRWLDDDTMQKVFYYDAVESTNEMFTVFLKRKEIPTGDPTVHAFGTTICEF